MSDERKRTSNANGIECPYCGHMARESEEIAVPEEPSDLHECGSCEKVFLCWATIGVTYYAETLFENEP